jgi:hypothetical protein
MHESCHLVALDKPFSLRIHLFIVQLSILNHPHPLWCLKCKTKMALSHIPLPWAHSYFSLSSFPNVKHLFVFWSPPSPWPSSNSTTWHGTYHFMSIHLVQWLVPRFHQLSNTKLGFSERKSGGEIQPCRRHPRLRPGFRGWLRRRKSGGRAGVRPSASAQWVAVRVARRATRGSLTWSRLGRKGTWLRQGLHQMVPSAVDPTEKGMPTQDHPLAWKAPEYNTLGELGQGRV